MLMKLSGIMLIICKEMPQPLFLKSMIIFFFYSKTPKYYYERVKVPLDKPVKRNRVVWNGKTKTLEVARDEFGKIIYDEFTDRYLDAVWEEDVLNIGQTSVTRKTSSECLGYPTQKPKANIRIDYRVFIKTW